MALSKPYRYWTNCPHLPGEFVQFVTDSDRAERITYGTFARHADLRPLRDEDHPAMYRISCKNNWSISFWKSKLPSGVLVYYFDWSRIEHIFVDREIDLENEMNLLTLITPTP